MINSRTTNNTKMVFGGIILVKGGRRGMLILWFFVAIFAIALDVLTSSFLFAWFSAGALAAMIAEVFNVTDGTQIVIFLLVNLITISIGYPLTRNKLKQNMKRIPLMEEKYIGLIKTAEEDILEDGRIKIDGIYWGVKNKGPHIKAGDKFKIIKIEGIKLVIKKEEEI